MSGRGHLPRHVIDRRRGYPDIPEGPFVRGPPRPHPALLEEEFELQQIELRRLMGDYHALVEDRLALQRELASGKVEIDRLNMIISDISTDKEAYIRELIGKGLKLEADLRVAEPLRNEVMQLRGEIDRQIAVKQELTLKVQTLRQELARAEADNQQVSILKSESDALRQEIMHARTAFEFEKKGNAELVEQRQAMEKNMISMAREVEKLRVDLANTEGRPWGAAGAYGIALGSPEATFPPYGDTYKLHSGVAEKAPVYGPGSGSWGTFDRTHVGRR